MLHLNKVYLHLEDINVDDDSTTKNKCIIN